MLTVSCDSGDSDDDGAAGSGSAAATDDGATSSDDGEDSSGGGGSTAAADAESGEDDGGGAFIQAELDGVMHSYTFNTLHFFTMALGQHTVAATEFEADDGTFNFTVQWGVDGPGTYDCAGSMALNAISHRAGAEVMSGFLSEDCTVVVDTMGDVGEMMTGTFSGTLVNILDEVPDIVVTNGSFNALREM